MSHDDVRRSLEVLDSVLAEFDDCLESWDSLQNGGDPCLYISEVGRNLDTKKFPDDELTGHIPTKYHSRETLPTDGSTSHKPEWSADEQIKVNSPPAVPKRSPATRLSERKSAVFSFPPSDNTSLDSYDSSRSDYASQDNNEVALSLSQHRHLLINALSADDAVDAGQNDDVFVLFGSNSCANCGCTLMTRHQEDKDVSSSPFARRRQIFEDKIAASRASPRLTRVSSGSSFRGKRGLEVSQDHPPSPLTMSNLERNANNDGPKSPISKLIKVAPPSVGNSVASHLVQCHPDNCSCKEKIKRLELKFAETRNLLKANKIKGMDKDPPSFIMPPPPKTNDDKYEQKNKSEIKQQSLTTPDLDYSSLVSSDSFQTAKDSNEPIDNSIDRSSYHTPPSKYLESHQESPMQNSKNSVAGLKLCSTCSKSLNVSLTETIEDLPKLLPTDALNRPQLGLSYSLEDDLSPGVKEIQRTSTPKSDSYSKDVSSLSTSSLGYVSSQSDLDLNNSTTDRVSPSTPRDYLPLPNDNVPVSMRSKTLPEGMKLSPFYSDADKVQELYSKYDRDRNFNRTAPASEVRSCSAPPEPEKTKKKHFRAFSRKEKKKKNGEFV